MNKNLVRSLYVFLIAVAVFTVAIRIRLLNVPLERDEGEYAYAGQLILKGIPPYSIVYNMKLPGIYVAYAAMLAIFGQSTQGIHLGLLFITAIDIFLLFLICRKLFDPAVAAIACAIYAILGLGEKITGFVANAEPFVMLFAMSAILVQIYAMEKRKLWLIFASGLLYGVSFLMKQHAAAFILFGGLWLLIGTIRSKSFSVKRKLFFPAVFATGVFLPYAMTCCLMWKLGVFKQFWFWTFEYARQYVSQIPLKVAPWMFIYSAEIIVKPLWPILALALIGLIMAVSLKASRKKGYFAICFFIFSFLSVCPGFIFRLHYFILMFPAMALLSALGVHNIYILLLKTKIRFLPQAVVILLPIFAVTYAIFVQRDYMFKMTCDQLSRECYVENPFTEAVEVAKYIKEHTKEDDLIAVMGSEPEIFFYSERKSATGYIYTYPLMEKQDYVKVMQQQMMDEIKKNKPKYIVLVKIYASWLVNLEVGKEILDWSFAYTLENYDVEGVVDIDPAGQTNYIWGESVKSYKIMSDSFMLICKRKEI